MSLSRVVIADDNAHVRSSLRVLLTSLFEIEVVGEAQDGIETLAILKQTQPDLLILDLNMPRMNGLNVLDHLKGREYAVAMRICVLSAHDSPAYQAEIVRRGATAFVAKGDAQQLVMTIRALLQA